MKAIAEDLFISLVVSILLIILQYFIEFKRSNKDSIANLIGSWYVVEHNQRVIKELRLLFEEKRFNPEDENIIRKLAKKLRFLNIRFLEIPNPVSDAVQEKSFKIYLSKDFKHFQRFMGKDMKDFDQNIHLESNGKVKMEYLEKEDINVVFIGLISSLQVKMIDYNRDFEIIEKSHQNVQI